MNCQKSSNNKNAIYINISSSNSNSSRTISYCILSNFISRTIKHYNSSSFKNKYTLPLSEELNSLSYSSYKNNRQNYSKRLIPPKVQALNKLKKSTKKTPKKIFSNIKNMESYKLPQDRKRKYYTPKKIVNEDGLDDEKKVIFMNINYQGKNLKDVFNQIKPNKNEDNIKEKFLKSTHVHEINNNIFASKNELYAHTRIITSSKVHNFKSFFHEFNKQIKNKEKDKKKVNILKLNKYNSSKKKKNCLNDGNSFSDFISISSSNNEIQTNKKDNIINDNNNDNIVYKKQYNENDYSFEDSENSKILIKTDNFNNKIINNKKNINIKKFNYNNNNNNFEQIKRTSNSQ